MRLLRIVVLLAVFVVMGAILIDFFSPIPKPEPVNDTTVKGMWIPYSQNLTTVKVTVRDVYRMGLSKTFDLLTPKETPYILNESHKGYPFKRAVFNALRTDAINITQKQYFFAADLAGFLKLNETGSAKYLIINPEEPFILEIEGAVPLNVNVTYTPAAEITIKKTGTGKFVATFKGYHGEPTIDLLIVCRGSHALKFGKVIEKTGWMWTSKYRFVLEVNTSNCAGVTEYWCDFHVIDHLKLRLDTSYEITRVFWAGKLHYYYEAACYWTVCGDDGSCTTVCSPCEPIEKWHYVTRKLPSWVKKPPLPSRNPAAEEYLLRMYAEAILKATEDVRKRTLEKIKEKGEWELYFGRLNYEEADRLLKYFYLVQIPLNVFPDDGLNTTRLEAIFERKANRSVVASLHTFVENTTYVNVTNATIRVYTHFGDFGEANTSVVFALLGSGQNFSEDYVPTSCGDVVVAELANYRQPALQNFRSIIEVPDELVMRKGYAPAFGVIYKSDVKRCHPKK